MKKIILLLTLLLCLCGCKKSLPLPEVESGIRGDLGIDKNINETNIDEYLNRDDAVYRDMRMLIDEADYEAIGGDSYLSGFVKGFEVVPYPYLCNVEGLPEAVGNSYSGETLFTHNENGEYVANYKESLQIIESLFPRDKVIFLMCGGGGYAGMTKSLLVSLGYDETKIYNVGGYWYYQGKNNVEVKYEMDGEVRYNFALVNYHEIDFDSLNCLGDCNSENKDIDIEKETINSNFIQIEGLDQLNELENNGKTFPLFVYLSGCPTCASFLPIVQEFSSVNNIEMYSLDLHDVWGSKNSVTDRIEYAPSMFIYKNGKVLAYLKSNSDDDYAYYKSYDKLLEWFNMYIDINEFDKCESCTLN